MNVKRWKLWRATEWAGIGIYWYLDDIACLHDRTCYQVSLGPWCLTFRPHVP